MLQGWKFASKQSRMLGNCGSNIEAAAVFRIRLQTWLRWKAKYTTTLRHRAILGKALVLMKNRVTSSAFHGWRDYYLRMADLKQRANQCIVKLKNRVSTWNAS